MVTPTVTMTAPTAAEPTSIAPTATSAAPAQTESAPPNDPALTLTISGGIVGFCDELTLDSSGGYRFQSCRQDAVINGTLAPADADALTAWLLDLVGFSYEFEDNPGGVDSMKSSLAFNGQGQTQADEAQQQLIFDWANSLLIRIRPQAVTPPTPEPIAVDPAGLCLNIVRPAVAVVDFSRSAGLLLVDPVSQATCPIQLQQPPFGRVIGMAGSLFYAMFDQTAKAVTVWQIAETGQQQPLSFTAVAMEQLSPYSFAVSADGRMIAWATASPLPNTNPPTFSNNLWLAYLDGSNQVTLLDQAQLPGRYAEPVRFSSDNTLLYYALQPDALGGAWSSFSGRYDNLYQAPTSGGESSLIFACPEGESASCIGDIAPDGSALAYAQADKKIVILSSTGQRLATLTPPALDFVGSPIFGPTGTLAFVSATLTQADEQSWPQANPGVISVIAPPYTGPVTTLLSGPNITTAWDWLDENRLIFGVLAENGNTATELVTLNGQRATVSPNFALTVLR
jgi:hypothetical protein